METIRTNTIIRADGHLSIDIPTTFEEGEVEVIIIIENKRPKPKYNFSDLAGKLKWDGDALKSQKEIRDEWQ
jgi:hypothetical protein